MAPDIKWMEAFDFTPADIITNRQGEMSLSQKEKTLKHGVIVFATFAGTGFLLAVLLFSDFNRKQPHITGQVAMFFCIVIFVIFSLIGLTFLWGAWSATKPGALRCASGRVSFQLVFFKTTSLLESDDKNLRLCIEGFRLRVKDPAAVRHLFISGAIYNVYFSPILGKVFSVETAKNYT